MCYYTYISFKKEVNDMYFVNRGSSSFISSIIFIGVFSIIALLLVNLFPVLLIAGVGIYGITKGVKLFKRWKSKNSYKMNSKDNVEIIDEKDFFDMTDKNIIDVEYTEVK